MFNDLYGFKLLLLPRNSPCNLKSVYRVGGGEYTEDAGLPLSQSCGSQNERKLVLRFSTGIYESNILFLRCHSVNIALKYKQ